METTVKVEMDRTIKTVMGGMAIIQITTKVTMATSGATTMDTTTISLSNKTTMTAIPLLTNFSTTLDANLGWEGVRNSCLQPSQAKAMEEVSQATLILVNLSTNTW